MLASMILAACGNKDGSNDIDADGGVFGIGGAELVEYYTDLKALEDGEKADKQKTDYDASTNKLIKRQEMWKQLDERKPALAETLMGLEVPTAVSESTPASILQPFRVKNVDVKKNSGISMIQVEGIFELKEDLPPNIDILGEDENGNLRWSPRVVSSSSHPLISHPDYHDLIPAGSKVALSFSMQIYSETFEDIFAVKKFVVNWLPIDEGMEF